MVIITPDRFDTIRLTIEHLRAQSARDRLEVVIVAPSAEEAEVDDQALAPFHGFHVVEVGGLRENKARAVQCWPGAGCLAEQQ